MNILINLYYRNEDWLYQQYTIQQKSTREIGRCCGVSDTTIRNWLKKYQIKRIGLHMDRDWLRHKYVDERLLTREIAELCNVSPPTVINYMKKYEISRRNASECRMGIDKGRIKSKEYRQHISEARMGWIFTKKTRKIMSISRKSYIRKHGHNLRGTKCDEKTRRLISATRQGISIDEWDGFVSFEPYCNLFNESLKEKIRNRDNRVCQLCGKSEIENGRRLSVHHIDGDKMQGCNGRSWYLVSLCLACNSRKDTLEKEFTIVVNSNIRRK